MYSLEVVLRGYGELDVELNGKLIVGRGVTQSDHLRITKSIMYTTFCLKDTRGALTRAMANAIVGKVVNMTVGRTKEIPTWSTWLSDWARDDGAEIHVQGIQTMLEETDDNEFDEKLELEPDHILQ
jgi:hypothetical protein